MRQENCLLPPPLWQLESRFCSSGGGLGAAWGLPSARLPFAGGRDRGRRSSAATTRHTQWIRFGTVEAREPCRRLPSDAWRFGFLRVGHFPLSQLSVLSHLLDRLVAWWASPASMCPSFCFLFPWGLKAASVSECWASAAFRVGFVLFFKLWGNDCLLPCLLPSFWIQFLSFF